MANRRNYYYLQRVTEAELDAGFEGLEVADRALAEDLGFVGIVGALEVSEAGTPDLTVDVAAPGTAYSKSGERIRIDTTQNVDVSQDDVGASTAVAVSGNEKYVSVFLKFARVESDPRIDGNSNPVDFVRDESFEISVVQGTEAIAGNAVPPALGTDRLLLADILRTFGQTQIFDADLDVSRREDWVRLQGGTIEIVAATAAAAISDLLDELNGHVDGTGVHAATAITYGGSPNWETGAALSGAPATVEAAIDTVVSDLADKSGAGSDGAARVGIEAIAATGGGLTDIAQGDVREALTATLGGLNAVESLLVGRFVLIGVQVFTSSGTWNRTDPNSIADVHLWGGGGGGGGAEGAGSGAASGGGGAGSEYVRKLVTTPGATETVTIGTGGTGGVGPVPGGNGGTTSFGAHASAAGGTGGTGGTTTTASLVSAGGTGGSGSSGDVAAAGDDGGNGRVVSGVSTVANTGGASAIGGTRRATGSNSNGQNAVSPGGGGSGANATTVNRDGGNGAAGRCVVYEYVSLT